MLLAVVAASSLAAVPTPTQACGPPSCATDQFLPVSGELPASAPAIALFAGKPSAGEDIAFECTDAAGAARAVPFELELMPAACPDGNCTIPVPTSLIKPMEPLVPGETCVLRGNECKNQWQGWDPLAGNEYLRARGEFAVAEPASLPTTLGTLELDPPAIEMIDVLGNSFEGCRAEVEGCVVRASVALSDEAKPWADALVYTTLLDGERWSLSQAVLPKQHGGSYLGRGRDLFYDVKKNARHPGEHRVVIRATLPGTDLMLETEAQTLVFDCWGPGQSDEPKGPGGSAHSDNSSCSLHPVPARETNHAWLVAPIAALALAVRRTSAARRPRS